MNASPPQQRLGIHNSPKRKRGAQDSIESKSHDSSQLSPGATNPRAHRPSQELVDRPGKPAERRSRAGSTGQLQAQDLQGAFVRQLAFTEAGHSKKRFAQSGLGERSQDDRTDVFSHEKKYTSSALEQAKEALGVEQAVGLEQSTSSPMIIDRPRTHSRSPPLDGDPDDNPLTWHESEITGHDPTDPDDDGYGINGIGFKPTPATAWARSQKRKQQLVGYRNREAQEARQQRRERRRGESTEPQTLRVGEGKKSAKVRFSDEH